MATNRWRQPGFLILICVVFVALFIDFIPPDDMTVTAIGETACRIHLHLKTNREYPKRLFELPKREGYINQITDGWGRTLLYSVDESGVISLKSYGRDGKPGGKGLDRDIIRQYRTRDDSGNFNIDDPLWIVESEIHEVSDRSER